MFNVQFDLNKMRVLFWGLYFALFFHEYYCCDKF
jgi:hypothetical protein